MWVSSLRVLFSHRRSVPCRFSASSRLSDMTPAADIALITGVITGANELLFAPLAGEGTHFNWRILPATGILALLIEGLSKISPNLAMGVSVAALITALFSSFGNAGSPITNAAKALGYAK